MSDETIPLFQLIREDKRYSMDAYNFVREALSYAADSLEMGAVSQPAPSLSLDEPRQQQPERHLTGQQFCEAARQYALNQFGFMAQVVLKTWGITSTTDFGNIVYNLIQVGVMKKSARDRRSDFDNVYEFEKAFNDGFRFSNSMAGSVSFEDTLNRGNEI